jgi:hypothetical protein
MNNMIRPWAAAIMAVLITACGQSSAPEGPQRGEWHTLSADWSATGTRQTLRLGPDHRASIFRLSGSMLISGDNRLGVGFRAEAIGFSDRMSSMVGTSVWTDDRGDQVFSTLRGEAVGTGNRVVGTFVGGTGRYTGVTGEYEFQWQYVISAEEGEVSGRAVGFKGRFRLGEPDDEVNERERR